MGQIRFVLISQGVILTFIPSLIYIRRARNEYLCFYLSYEVQHGRACFETRMGKRRMWKNNFSLLAPFLSLFTKNLIFTNSYLPPPNRSCPQILTSHFTQGIKRNFRKTRESFALQLYTWRWYQAFYNEKTRFTRFDKQRFLGGVKGGEEEENKKIWKAEKGKNKYFGGRVNT